MVIVLLLCASPNAMAAWSTLETDHFYIHFASLQGDLANEVAWRAELAHQTLTQRLGHTPVQKTHIIIRDDTDLANAYASPIYENHIVIHPVFPTVALGYLNGFDYNFSDWLTLLIVHEYTHILHMDMKTPSAVAITSVLGRVPLLSSPMLIAPPMMIEGYAVYHESQTGEGRGNSSYYAMYLRTAAMAKQLPPIDQVIAEYPLSRWQPGGHVYLYGYAFLDYLTRLYGQNALDQLNQSLLRRPDSLSRAVGSATGRSLASLWSDWQAETEARVRTEVALLAQHPITQTPAFETSGYHAFFPTPAPLGDAVAFLALGGVVPSLRLLDPLTKNERHLANVQALASTQLAWHPSGGHLVVAALTDGGAGSMATELAHVDARTGKISYLPNTAQAYSPTYNNHGTSLAFIKRSGLVSELWLRDNESGSDKRLFSDSNVTIVSAAWSPVADRLALTLWSQEQGSYLALYDLDTARLTPIVGGGASYGPAAWSVDGEWVLFSADRSGVFNLYAYNVGRATLVRLTNTLTGLFSPSMLSDGSLIAMVYTTDGYRLTTLPFEPAQGSPQPAWDQDHDRDRVLAPGVVSVRGPSPYTPWRSLMPKFWLPSVQEQAGETQFGVTTAGRDILGNTAYTASLALGIVTGKPSYAVSLQQVLNQRGDIQFTAGVRDVPVARPGSSGMQWYDQTQITVGLQWVGRLGTGQQSSWAMGTRTVERLRGSGAPAQPEHRVELGWEAAQAGGQLAGRFSNKIRVRGSADVLKLNAWDILIQAQSANAQASGEAVRFALSVGILGSIDGLQPDLQVRGYKQPMQAGTLLIQATAEGRIPLLQVDRGYLDAAVFLKDVALHPFVDGGYSKVHGTEAKRSYLALGAELGFDMYLAYGAVRADWRIGIAQGRGEPSPSIYLRVASGF